MVPFPLNVWHLSAMVFLQCQPAISLPISARGEEGVTDVYEDTVDAGCYIYPLALGNRIADKGLKPASALYAKHKQTVLQNMRAKHY